MNDKTVTQTLFLLCLLVQAQEQRIRRLEEFNARLAREFDRREGKQKGHLRRVK